MESQQKSSEKFSRNLRMRAGKLNLQANEIAEHLGIEPSAVSNWMNGTNMPKKKNIRALATLLKCESDWLLGETENLKIKDDSPAYVISKDETTAELETWRRRAKDAEKRLHDISLGMRGLLALSAPGLSAPIDWAKLLKLLSDQYDQNIDGNKADESGHSPPAGPS